MRKLLVVIAIIMLFLFAGCDSLPPMGKVIDKEHDPGGLGMVGGKAAYQFEAWYVTLEWEEDGKKIRDSFEVDEDTYYKYKIGDMYSEK